MPLPLPLVVPGQGGSTAESTLDHLQILGQQNRFSNFRTAASMGYESRHRVSQGKGKGLEQGKGVRRGQN